MTLCRVQQAGAMMQALSSAPTPTPHGRSRMRPPNHGVFMDQGIQGRKVNTATKKRRIGQEAKLPIRCASNLSGRFGVWVTVWFMEFVPHFDPGEEGRSYSKNARNSKISGVFWSCRAVHSLARCSDRNSCLVRAPAVEVPHGVQARKTNSAAILRTCVVP